MFCPRCGAENTLEPKFCRQCGLELTAARIALLDEALTKSRKSAKLLTVGAMFLILAVIAALANSLMNPALANYGVILNLLSGLFLAVPMILVGTLRLRRAQQVLQPKDERGRLESDYSQGSQTLAAAANTTGRLLTPVEAKAPDSITEGTTRHLTTPERRR